MNALFGVVPLISLSFLKMKFIIGNNNSYDADKH